MSVQLFEGDCLEIMKTLPNGCVDAIITDLPYGTTACKWDEVIPFAPMWEQVKRVLKPRGAFVTTASQPFTSALIVSNMGWFKYCLVWGKRTPPDFYAAKYRPLTAHEDICVFSAAGTSFGSKTLMHYYPVMIERDRPVNVRDVRGNRKNPKASSLNGKPEYVGTSTHWYPKSILDIGVVTRGQSLHPTQKPVALYAYLIRTYTNPGDTVLDFCMGSGTTGVAAAQEGRRFIGIEKDAGYFAIAQRRIEQAQMQMPLLELAAD